MVYGKEISLYIGYPYAKLLLIQSIVSVICPAEIVIEFFEIHEIIAPPTCISSNATPHECPLNPTTPIALYPTGIV